MTGISVSDLIRLYYQHVEPGRQHVVCPELLADTRLVSIRSTSANTAGAVQQLLGKLGYSITQRAGITYICPTAEQDTQKAEFPVAGGVSSTDPMSVSGSPATSIAGSPAGDTKSSDKSPFYTPIPNGFAQYPMRSTGYRALEEGREPQNYIDRLVNAGWMFAGCTGGGGMPIKVLLRSADAGLMVPLSEVRKSNVSHLLQCRVDRADRATRGARRESRMDDAVDDLMIRPTEVAY